MPSETAAIVQMLSGAIVAGELEANSANNAFARLGDHRDSLVQRSQLVSYAQFKNLHPAFLFDTIAPFKPEPDPLSAPEPVELSNPNDAPVQKGGRPASYDWDSFIGEVVRIANTPDGLPEKQADLVRKMQSWFSETYDAEPADSTIKTRISKIYRYLHAHKKKAENS